MSKRTKNNSYTINDYYAWYTKNKPAGKEYVLTEKEHNMIIREVFNAVLDHLANGEEIQLGKYLGVFKLMLYTYDNRIWVDEEGVLHNHLPVDWDKLRKKKKGELLESASHKWTSPIPVVLWKKQKTCNLRNKMFLGYYVNRGFKNRINKIYREGGLQNLEKVKDVYGKQGKAIAQLWRRDKQ